MVGYAFDEQLFAHVRVIDRLRARDHDDVVDRRGRAVLLPVAQHTRDDARLVAVQRLQAETTRREIVLRRVENVPALADIEQEIEGKPLVPERIPDPDGEIRLAIVAGFHHRGREYAPVQAAFPRFPADRKSTRLNSSHSQISYAVFCLK